MNLSRTMWACAVVGLPLLVVAATAKSEQAAGAEQSTDPAAAQPQAAVQEQQVDEGHELEGFRLSVKPKKRSYVLGEAIGLKVTFKNLKRGTVDVPDWGGIGRTYKLDIVRPDGTPAPLTPRGKIMRSSNRGFPIAFGMPFEPGSKQEFQMAVSAYFDVTQVGEYTLRVSRQVPTRDDPKKIVTLYSNTLKIRIEAPAPPEDEEDAADEDAAG